MLSRWPIRKKLLFGVALLCLIVAMLSFSSLRGVYAYRELVRTISRRALELQPAADLIAQVGELRFALRRAEPLVEFPATSSTNKGLVREQFEMNLWGVREKLRAYRQVLSQTVSEDPYIGNKQREEETVADIEKCLQRITTLNAEHDWVLDRGYNMALETELDRLSDLAGDLPKYLQQKMLNFRDEVRLQYRTFIVLTWVATVLTVAILALLVRLFYVWVFRPLRILIAGSRRVATGNFSHRIQLDTHDEVAELAAAMNAMTARFQQVRDELDQQVKQRTQEVLRSEQLASVGFLAAGVAHEINNPLASIAWSAESLESRLYEILHQPDELNGPADADAEIDGLRAYLRRIQDEAFRCKGITERLLDFSRLGDLEKHETDLRELAQGVIDMVKHLGKYRNKKIEFECDQYVVVSVNAQEIKQVVLNLITNALDCLDREGTVHVALTRTDENAELVVTDDGIGMTEEVKTHLFEPFFTRRRGGHGTGLGLSITYRIVSDHGGQIEAASDGPGKGSQFKVTLPLSHHEEEHLQDRHAA